MSEINIKGENYMFKNIKNKIKILLDKTMFKSRVVANNRAMIKKDKFCSFAGFFFKVYRTLLHNS